MNTETTSIEPTPLAPSLLSAINRPIEAEHLQAVLERIEELKQGPRPYLFQDWLDEQYALHKNLKKFNGHTSLEFLYQQGSDIRKPISPHAISVALAIGERWGWDPHFQGCFPDDSRDSRTVCGDETILEWLTVHRGTGSSLPDNLFWPITLDEFIVFDGQHQPPRDTEWLMAMIIASGVNPWIMKRPERRELALHNCISKGHHKIAAQLVALAGAPSLRELMEAPFFYREEKNVSEHVFSDLGFSFSNKLPFVESTVWSMVQAACPGFRYTLEETAQLPLNLFEKALNHNLLPDIASNDLIEYLENQLQKSRTYGAKGLLERRELLQPQNTDVEEEQVRAVTQSILDGNVWGGKIPWMGLREQQGCGSAWLCRKTRVEGPWAGNWSVFNAHVFWAFCGAEHTSNTYGATTLPWAEWLFEKRPDTFFQEATVEKTYPELAQLLNEDLENGLPVAGLWTLVLLGKHFYDNDDPSFFPTTAAPSQIHQPLIRVERLASEAVALGIDNWQHFFDQHREAAVVASEWLMTHAPAPQREKARTALQRVWGRCWKRYPSWMEGHPELVTRLVRLLSVGFQPDWTNLDEWSASKNPWTEVLFSLRALFPCEFQAEISHLSPFNLAYILALHHPSEMEDAIEWLEQAPSPDPQMLSWVREWLPDHGGLTPQQRQDPKYPLSQELICRLAAAALEHYYPETDRETVRERL